jgi:TonB family protein
VGFCQTKGEIDAQKYLESKLMNHVLILRDFPDDNRIEYDQNGRPVSKIHTGAWTTAKMQVQQVKIDPQRIELRGPRVFTYYNDKLGRLEASRIRESYRLVLNLDASSRNKNFLDAALARIFILTDRDFVDSVPEYWRPFLLGHVRKDKNGNPELTDWPPERNLGAQPSVIDAMKLPEGSVPPKRLQSTGPHYPQAARRLGLVGDVVIQAIIGKDGKMHEFAVLKPMGAGVEEEALSAVRQWIYTPATVHGQPIEVSMTITLHFTIVH